jgi:hypothetical protein
MPISGYIISKCENSEHNHWKLKKESGSLISVVEETLGGLKVIKVTMLSLLLKVD